MGTFGDSKTGELSEWFMVAVLKTVERVIPLRGFESYTLRKRVGLQSNKFLAQYYKQIFVAALNWRKAYEFQMV